MKSIYSFIAVLFLVLLTNSISLADDWVKTSGLPAGANQCEIATGSDNGNPVQFLLETSGLGLFKSTDDGTTWEYIGLQGVGITAIVDNLNNSGEYIVSAPDGVHKTTDGGTTWQHYTTGIEGLFITDIAPVLNTDYLVVGTVGNGVFKSTDVGKTWQQLGTGLDNKTITSIEVILGQLYATTQEDGAWNFAFSSGLWTPINDGNNNLVGTTAIGGDSQGNLFLASSPNILSSLSVPVFWQFETELDFTNTIVVTPDDKVFASSYGDGVKRRASPGDWTPFSDGLPADNDGFIDVIRMTQDKTNNTESSGSEVYLWAAVVPLDPTIIGGIYRTVNPVTDVKDKIVANPEDFSLEQNYPNPFNPTTKISWQTPVGSHQTLKIYDVLGNEVVTLVNEYKSVGGYEVIFDASGLSSGIYFYQLQAGSFVETKKMLLLK